MICINSLSFKYDDKSILHSINFTLKEGEIVALKGKSAEGKSTLLRLIVGLEKPDKGEIKIDGEIVSTNQILIAPYLRKSAIAFQEPALWAHMTILSHLEFVANNQLKQEREEHILMLLKLSGLEKLANTYPSKLSGGEARRLEIIRALASKPKYLLLDEPFNDLDIDNKNKMAKLIYNEAKAFNMGVLIVTHEQNYLNSVQKEYCLRDGKLYEKEIL